MLSLAYGLKKNWHLTTLINNTLVFPTNAFWCHDCHVFHSRVFSRPSSPFDWPQNTWPWMTLNCHFTLNSVFAQVHVIFLFGFRNNCVNRQQEYSAWVSGDIGLMLIFAGILQIFVRPTYTWAHMSFWLFVRGHSRLDGKVPNSSGDRGNWTNFASRVFECYCAGFLLCFRGLWYGFLSRKFAARPLSAWLRRCSLYNTEWDQTFLTHNVQKYAAQSAN